MRDKISAPLPARWFARLILAFAGVVWLSVGLAGLLDPLWLADLLDFQLTSATAHNEFRAIYGGLCLALASLHFVAVIRSAWLVPALVSSLVCNLGLMTGRGFSIAVDSVPGPVALGLFGGELLLSAVTVFALWRLGVLVKDERATVRQQEQLAVPGAAAEPAPEATNEGEQLPPKTTQEQG